MVSEFVLPLATKAKWDRLREHGKVLERVPSSWGRQEAERFGESRQQVPQGIKASQMHHLPLFLCVSLCLRFRVTGGGALLCMPGPWARPSSGASAQGGEAGKHVPTGTRMPFCVRERSLGLDAGGSSCESQLWPPMDPVRRFFKLSISLSIKRDNVLSQNLVGLG